MNLPRIPKLLRSANDKMRIRKPLVSSMKFHKFLSLNCFSLSSFCSSMKQTINLVSQNQVYAIKNEQTKILNKLLLDQKYQQAIEQCRIALPKSIDPHRVRYILAHALKNSEQIDEAIEEFQIIIKEVISAEGDTLKLAEGAHFELAFLYKTLSDYSSSLFHAETAMELNEVLAITDFAELYILSGEIERGIAFYQRLQRRASANEWLPYYEGALLEKLDKFEEAIAAYEKSIELSPKHTNGHASFRIGIIQKNLVNYSESTMHLTRAAELNKEDYTIMLNLGQNHRILGKGQLGKECLETCLKLNPDDPQPYYDLALCYEQLGDIEKCTEYLQKNLEHYRDHIDTIQRLTNIFAAKGDKEQTLKYINIAVEQDPFLKDNEDYKYFVQLIEKNSLDAEVSTATTARPQLHQLLVKILNEIEEQHQSADTFGNIPLILNSFTQLLLIFGRSDLAVEPEKRLLGIGHNDLQHRLNLAALYRTNGEYQSAIEQYKILMRLLPGEPNYPYFCGQIQLQSGDIKSAIESYCRSLGIQDSNDYCLYELSYCYYLDGQQELHDRTQRTLLSLFPNFYNEEVKHIAYIHSLRKKQ